MGGRKHRGAGFLYHACCGVDSHNTNDRLNVQKQHPFENELITRVCFGGLLHLLCVVGGVREHSRDMEHNFVVLVARVEGMFSCGVGYMHTRNTNGEKQATI